MKPVSLSLVFAATGVLTMASCSYRLEPYQDLLVGEPAVGATTAANPEADVQLTYLGTAGYLLEWRETAIVIDPYFTRTSLRYIALNAPLEPDREAIEPALARADFPDSIDAWLITHAHFDHLLDVPYLQQRFGGTIVTSTTGFHLCRACEVPEASIHTAQLGEPPLQFGGARIRVHQAGHDRVFGRIPYPGIIDSPMEAPPARPRDWKVGAPLAFEIEIGGKRLYVESGGVDGLLPDLDSRPIDLAILGVAVGDSQKRYPEMVRTATPRFVLTSHQDDFFQPLSSGFLFGPTTDFPKILATHRGEELPGEIVLMDFFHRWTIP